MAAGQQVHHLATLAHDGRFWDVYLELADQEAPGDPARGRIAFSPGDRAEGEAAVRTAEIFVEPSSEEAIARARALREHHLLGLLRSCLP